MRINFISVSPKRQKELIVHYIDETRGRFDLLSDDALTYDLCETMSSVGQEQEETAVEPLSRLDESISQLRWSAINDDRSGSRVVALVAPPRNEEAVVILHNNDVVVITDAEIVAKAKLVFDGLPVEHFFEWLDAEVQFRLDQALWSDDD